MRHTRGQASVELALVTLVLAMLVVGMVSASEIVQAQIGLSAVAEEAALSAALARVVSVWSTIRSLLNCRSVTIPMFQLGVSRNGIAYQGSGAGNCSFRRPGKIIVADHPRSDPGDRGHPRHRQTHGHLRPAHYGIKGQVPPDPDQLKDDTMASAT